MKYFSFKFIYKSKSCRATGNGNIKAETLEQAMTDAKNGVASDFGGSVNSVVITSITELKNIKRKG